MKEERCVNCGHIETAHTQKVMPKGCCKRYVRLITIEDYSEKMDEIISRDNSPVHEKLINILCESSKYRIKES